MNRKKLLIIFSVLLLLFVTLSIIIIFINNRNKCNFETNQYLFQNSANCSELLYESTGIFFNPQIDQDRVTFSLNFWNAEDLETFYEDFSIDDSKLDIKNNLISSTVVKPVKLISVWQENQQQKFFGKKSYELKKVVIEEIDFDFNKYVPQISSIVDAIEEGPIKGRSNKMRVLTAKINDNDYGISYSNGGFVSVFYRPWLYSYISRYSYSNNIKHISEYIDEEYSLLIKEIEEIKEKDPTAKCPGGQTDPLQANITSDFSCRILLDIYRNDKSVNINKYLNSLCNDDYFQNASPGNKDFPYTFEDLLASINAERIRSAGIYEPILDKTLAITDVSTILVNLNAKFILTGHTNSSISEENYLDRIAYSIIWENAFDPQNLCSLIYDSTILDDQTSPIYPLIKDSLTVDPEMTLKIFEQNPYGSVICQESFKNEDKKDKISWLMSVALFRILDHYFYDNEEIQGYWIKNQYDIKTNARVAKLLLEKIYEK